MRRAALSLALTLPGVAAAGGRLSSLSGFNKIIASGLGEDLSFDEELYSKATAFENSRLINDPSLASAMLACSPLSLGAAARVALEDFLGEEQVIPAYSSREEDTACFVVTASWQESQDLRRRRIVEDISSLPASARLAEGTLSYKISLDAMDATGMHPHDVLVSDELRRGGSKTKSRKEHPVLRTARSEHERTPVALSHHLLDHHAPTLRLVLAPGIGTDSKGAGKRMVREWLEALDSGRAHDEIARDFFWAQSLDADHPLKLPVDHPHGRVWTSALDRVRAMRTDNSNVATAQCSFKDVSVEEIEGAPGHFSLNGLETLALSTKKRDALRTGAGKAATGKARLIERTMDIAAERDACWLTLLAHLTSRPEVLLVAPKPKVKSHNYFAARITQGGTYDAGTTFWDLGVNGSTQVVGAADTGVDEYSCFFYDSENGLVERTSKGGTSKVDTKQRKLIQYVEYVDDEDETYGHGSHVVGSIAGKMYSDADVTGAYVYDDTEAMGASKYLFTDTDKPDSTYRWSSSESKGMAHEAKIAFFDIGDEEGSLETPADLAADMFPYAKDAGAQIHSDSWGTSYNGYSSDDIGIDQYSVDNDDFLVLIAAGNDGDYGYHTVGSPAVSKNCLAVGASEDGRYRFGSSGDECDSSSSPCDFYVASFSSKGPTRDGRIKPDVLAPGYSIVSAHSAGYSSSETCETAMMGGTSMATPVTAGNAALILDFFAKGFYARHSRELAQSACSSAEGSSCSTQTCWTAGGYDCGLKSISGALLKALLINSGESMAALYDDDVGYYPLYAQPDYIQGHGLVNLENALSSAGSSATIHMYVDDATTASSGDIKSYHFEVQAAGTDLRATLTWMDPVGWMATMKQVLHDLDLTIEDPSGKIWLANNRTWKGTTDELNNVEKILIPGSDTVAGVYTINVTTHALLYDTQKYALAVSGNGWVFKTSSSSYNATDAYACEDIYRMDEGFEGQDCSTLSDSECCTMYGSPTDWASNTSWPGYCDKSCGYCFTNDDKGCYDDTDDDDWSSKPKLPPLAIAGIAVLGTALLVGAAVIACKTCGGTKPAGDRASGAGDFPSPQAASPKQNEVIEVEVA